MGRLRSAARAGAVALGAGATALGAWSLFRRPDEAGGAAASALLLAESVPPRAELLRRLADGTADNPFDVLIVGGGATGTGCAVDAATRRAALPRPVPAALQALRAPALAQLPDFFLHRTPCTLWRMVCPLSAC